MKSEYATLLFGPGLETSAAQSHDIVPELGKSTQCNDKNIFKPVKLCLDMHYGGNQCFKELYQYALK